MTIAEIRKLEEDRDGKLNIVHLQKEGSFYHANDWSAYLMTKYPIGEALNKPMAVTAKKLKDGYIHAFVGFPATSIGKYVPNDGSISFTPVSDTQIDVTLNLDFGEATVEQVREMVDEWKESLPLAENMKQHRDDHNIQTQAPRITKISDIIGRILSIPMEDISPKQAYDILRELRRDVAAIF